MLYVNIYEQRKREQEYKDRQAGMRRAGKEWARSGNHQKFHPLSMAQARELYEEGRLFFNYTEEKNVRKAHCKVCGHELTKDEGIRMPIYARNFYNLSFYFCCEKCYNTLQMTDKDYRDTRMERIKQK